MRRSDVFTPNKLPSVTYVGEHLVEKRKLLTQYLEQGGAVVAISGPSKSGKTVFIETVIGRDNLIQVTGAHVTSPEDIWRRVFTQIGTPIPSTETETTTKGATGTLSFEGAVPLVAKASAQLGGKQDVARAATQDVRPDSLTLLVRELKGSGLVIFIDDFHYISKDIQAELATVIKEAVRDGLGFILASVPYHADDVVLANSDLRGRMLKLDFDYWDVPELSKIAVRGFEVLNVEVSPETIQGFAAEAAGSPQLMQSLCLNLCFETGIEETIPSPPQEDKVMVDAFPSPDVKRVPGKVLQHDPILMEAVCRRTAQTNDYSTVIRVMKQGPKVRGNERKPYLLKDGKTILDVYPILVQAIAVSPPAMTLDYQALLARVNSLCDKDHPTGSSVSTACSHMSSLANDAAGAQILEWDGEHEVLDIRDPYLLFALRWDEKE